MYDFHHNFIKKNFSAKLLFADTDNLTYEIKSEIKIKIFIYTTSRNIKKQVTLTIYTHK